MNESSLYALAITAIFIGTVHTILGPDHYLPFIALSQARRWSTARTVSWTIVCGVAHVASSALLGLAGVALGLAVGGLQAVEAMRGEIAAWLMFGFGVAYGLWGLRRALRRVPHEHWHFHRHDDGTEHRHPHRHGLMHGHAHSHQHSHEDSPKRSSTTPWVLFIVFALGPCEPLIPILMYPAAQHSRWGLILVTLTFGIATITTMTAAVLLGRRGLRALPTAALERYAHALAGAALAVCGLTMQIL